MLFGTGPVSFFFNDAHVASAADAYVTCLVPVPDGYELVWKYKAMRPGLLVLNSKGEKVANAVLHHKEPGKGYDPEWIHYPGTTDDGRELHTLFEYPWVWTVAGMIAFLEKHTAP